MNDIKIKRGELYYADLDPVIGSEQGGIRPVLIIQNNRGNHHSGTTIIAPLTSEKKPPELPIHVFISRKCSCLKRNSWVLLEQIKTIDKSRLKSRIGRLNGIYMGKVDIKIMISLGLLKERKNNDGQRNAGLL